MTIPAAHVPIAGQAVVNKPWYQRFKWLADAVLSSRTQVLTGYIGAPVNGNYTLALAVPYGFTAVSFATQCESGTATAVVKRNATAVTGLTNAVSSSLVTSTATAANSFEAGDSVVMTISAASSCLKMAWSLKITRAYGG